MAFDLSKSGFGDRASSGEQIKMIPLDLIQTNEFNFYEVARIRELAESISMVGLMDPVRVIPLGYVQKDGYRLVSGHRRFAAYQLLREEQSGYDRIPAITMSNLDSLQEQFALISANATARELTYAEKLKQEAVLRSILIALQEQGQKLPKGLSQSIADAMGVSRNEVSRMHSVNEHLIPEVREQVDAGHMTAQQAYETSRKPAEEQKQAVRETAEKAPAVYLCEARAREEAEKILEKMGPSMGMLAKEAARALTRKEGAELLKKSLNWSGGNYFTGHGSLGCAFGMPGRKTNVLKWQEVYDYLALYAIRALAADEPEESEQAEAEGWKTGKPKEAGRYVAAFDVDGNTMETLCYYDGAFEKWLFKKNGHAIDAKVIRWFRLPDVPEE